MVQGSRGIKQIVDGEFISSVISRVVEALCLSLFGSEAVFDEDWNWFVSGCDFVSCA